MVLIKNEINETFLLKNIDIKKKKPEIIIYKTENW